jgi:hypothetical protein
MVTTINSTALDFNNIKSSLKTYLAGKSEFTDYDFESAGLSNVLDVLAYNTHINALMANFALNESYLSTAQLRSSVVSLSEGIGYIPTSVTAAAGVLDVSFTNTNNSRPSTVELPAFTKFTSTINDEVFVFQTLEEYSAQDDGTGFYQFKDTNGSREIKVKEGSRKSKNFLVGEYEENPVYIIPDTEIDTTTTVITVFETAIGGIGSVYTNINDAVNITSQSTIYLLKESPNGFFELSFGDGETFGVAPAAGSRINVSYLSTKGKSANGGNIFHAQPSTLDIILQNGGTEQVTLDVTTTQRSIGGDNKESIESIRLKAPFQYASQNRMVTAEDYAALILRKYSSLIKDIIAWGGEDNLDPEFGAVYVSIDFEDDITELTQSNTKIAILDLAEQLAVISFKLRFSDPVTTFIEIRNFFQFNPKLTTLTLNSIQAQVSNAVEDYFQNNTGKFHQSFRRSNMLTKLDEVSSAVLSSRAEIRMQQRFNPVRPTLISTISNLANNIIDDEVLNNVISLVNDSKYDQAASVLISLDTVTSSYSVVRTALLNVSRNNNVILRFPVPIANPDDENLIVTSSNFIYLNKVCQIRNVLSSNTLQIVSLDDGSIMLNNVGEYHSEKATVTLLNFVPESLLSGETEIKVSVSPANQASIAPTRNNILELDKDLSFSKGIITTATN